MSVKFEWSNPDRIITDVKRILDARGQAINRIPERAVRRGTFELLKRVQDEVPKATTTLVKSITAVVTKISADVVEGKVGTWIEYARYLEEGTGIYGPYKRPITIVARKRRGLFWGAFDKDGDPVVRKRVTIQGMKPRSPFGKAMALFLPRYIEIIEQELAREAAA